MKTYDQRRLKTHIPIVGWMLIAVEGLTLLFACFILVLLTSIGAVSRDQTALTVLATISGILFFFMVALSIPGLVAGFGLLARKAWARTLAIVWALFSLALFPVGTIIGGYALWVLFQEAATDYFDAQSQKVAEPDAETPPAE